MKVVKSPAPQKTLTTPLRYLLMSIGILVTAVGVYFFKFPNNFSTGGVSGLSLILGRLFPSPVLTPSVFMLLINAALLVVGLLVLGRSFAFSTVYCSMLLSLSTYAMERLWPLAGPLTDQPFLELCFAVLLPAIGSAVLFHLDASSGGTDIIALILKKYTSLNIGGALMAADALITVAALVCFGVKAGLFSILGLLMKSVLVDFVTDSFQTRKCFQIITSDPEPIVSFIMEKLHRGATIEDVHGAYSHEQKTLIITVLGQTQALHGLTDEKRAVFWQGLCLLLRLRQHVGGKVRADDPIPAPCQQQRQRARAAGQIQNRTRLYMLPRAQPLKKGQDLFVWDIVGQFVVAGGKRLVCAHACGSSCCFCSSSFMRSKMMR